MTDASLNIDAKPWQLSSAPESPINPAGSSSYESSAWASPTLLNHMPGPSLGGMMDTSASSGANNLNPFAKDFPVPSNGNDEQQHQHQHSYSGGFQQQHDGGYSQHFHEQHDNSGGYGGSMDGGYHQQLDHHSHQAEQQQQVGTPSSWEDFAMSELASAGTHNNENSSAFTSGGAGSSAFPSEPLNGGNHFTVSSAFNRMTPQTPVMGGTSSMGPSPTSLPSQSPHTAASSSSSSNVAPSTRGHSTLPQQSRAQQDNMPKEMCKFFQFGGCTRDDCPFSHELKVEAPAGVDTSKGFILCSNVANMRMSPPKKVDTMNIRAQEYIPQSMQQQQSGGHRRYGSEVSNSSASVYTADTTYDSSEMSETSSRYGTGGPSKRPYYNAGGAHSSENEYPSPSETYSTGGNGMMSGSGSGLHGGSMLNAGSKPYTPGGASSPAADEEDSYQHPAQKHLHVRPTSTGAFSVKPMQQRFVEEPASGADDGYSSYRRQQAMRAPLQVSGSAASSHTSGSGASTPTDCTTPSLRPMPSNNGTMIVENVDLADLPKVSERRKPQQLVGNTTTTTTSCTTTPPAEGAPPQIPSGPTMRDILCNSTPEPQQAAAGLTGPNGAAPTSAMMHRMLRNGSLGPIAIGN